MRARRPRPLAPRPARPAPTFGRLRPGLTHLVVLRRRTRGVLADTREQMLHPRQPHRKILIRRRQRLVRRDQLRDPPRLHPDEHDQLITGQPPMPCSSGWSGVWGVVMPFGGVL